jgi:hypothetical protein
LFTDDDGSGKFTQKTLVHFAVEEGFKGIQPGVHDVWVDPGSCTSCYAEYHPGERFLLFGYGGRLLPPDSQTVSVANEGCKSKLLPAEIDPNHPPKIYAAPECAGTSILTPETEHSVARDLVYLRKYKAREQKAKSQKGKADTE